MAVLRRTLALLIAIGAGIALGGAPSVAAPRPGGLIRLAKADEPSLPSYVEPAKGSPRAAPREQTITPFALPTSAITASKSFSSPASSSAGS